MQKEKYINADEVNLDLMKLKPADLTSEKTLMSDALRLCYEVMQIISKCKEDLHPSNFNEDQRDDFLFILKKLGCASYDDAAPKFTPHKQLINEGKLIELKDNKNNIELPLTIFKNLYIDFDCALERINGYRWILEQDENAMALPYKKTQRSLNNEKKNEK